MSGREMKGIDAAALNSAWAGGTHLVMTRSEGSGVAKYGAAGGGQSQGKLHSVHAPRAHQAHFVSIIVQVLIPPILFCMVMTALTFSWHFRYPVLVWIIPILASLPTLLFVRDVRTCTRQGMDAGWSMLGIITFSLSVALAVLAGQIAYWYYLHPFYTIDSMKTYTNIDPATTSGKRLMDGGRVYFGDKAYLDINMGMSYTDWDTYCVAPITDSASDQQNTTLATYDLWAVGINCCRSEDPVFGCGHYNNPHARAGLRQVAMEQRGFFQLAVQQAEAAYDIRADNPIFFYWSQDPDRDVSVFFETGFKIWVLSLCLQFAINFFMVLAYAFLTSIKMKHRDKHEHRMNFV